MRKKPSWKQNLRKIPDQIRTKIEKFDANDVVVSCVKRIRKSDIQAGRYLHLNINIKDNKPVFSPHIVPKESVGKYSGRNVNGYEIVRKDLPMIYKTFTWESPDYGDWSKGSHEVSIDREVYQRDFIPPHLVEIEIELIAEELKGEELFVFKFTIDEVLDRSSISFNEDLLTNLNLLQENVGACDAYQSDASIDDYLKTIYVHWEILPPGERGETISKLFSGFKTTSEEVHKQLVARYDMLSKLNPVAYISGSSGFRRYFGAKFCDNLVVFENLEYGNAIYVMFGDWRKLSQMSRIELLSGEREGFVRIVHSAGWKERLTKVINDNQ